MLLDLSLDNWINLYIHWELSLIKDLGFESSVTKISTDKNVKQALAMNRNLLMENFIIPNRLRYPLFRNILEKYIV